jgi:hypothetical protein
MSRLEAHSILPTAVFHPPAGQGDLLAAVDLDGAEILGLVDGTFHQNLSVWHSEICYLLSRGIVIFGASSMGALRAVETDLFGMIGIGHIYEWYRDGVVTADDEVALLHGDEVSGFRQMSLPLVNVRASIDQASAAGLMAHSTAKLVIEIARSLYYPDRQLPLILERCRDEGFTFDQLTTVERVLTADYVDQKLTDARGMLCAMRRVIDGIEPLPVVSPFEFTRSAVFESLYNMDRKITFDPGAEVTLEDVSEYVALQSLEYDAVRRHALNREVVAFFGVLLGIDVSEEEILSEQKSFFETHGIESPRSFQQWLQSNALCESDLRDYLRQEALCHRLRRWIQDVQNFDRGSKAVLDELRMRGAFPSWARKAKEDIQISSTYSARPEYVQICDEDPRRLAEKHAASTGVHITGDARVWAEDAGFDGVYGLEKALRRFAVSNDVRGRIARLLDALERARAIDAQLASQIERME